MAFVFARPVWSTPAASRLGKWLKIASGLLLFSAYTAITTSCGLPAQSANLSAAGASSKLSSFEFANHGWGGHIRVSVSLPPATVGNAYNAVVSVSGGTTPYQFSVVSGSLPIGLSLNPSAGTISGIPVTAGTYKFTVQVVDAAGLSDEKRFMLSVAAAPVAPAVSVQISPLSPTVSSGTAKQFNATVSNTSDTAVTWSTTAGAISTSGVFSAPDVSVASTATVIARSVADPTKAAATTVTITVSSPVVPPQSTGFDGPAELPRVYVQSAITDTPAPGNIITVNAGGSLQNALNAANCGDTILLQAGATFAGVFTFPAKSCDDNHWIVVRTSAPDSVLPPEGTRITPCYAGNISLPGRPAFNCSAAQNVMARIAIPSSGVGPLVFASGANHYRLIGLEVTRPVGGIVYSLISLAKGVTADHLVFDRMWLHGTPQDETTKGIQLGGSRYVAVVDSFFTDFHCTSMTGACTDALAIGGGAGDLPMGPYKIVNNFLESSGENILFGGAEATFAPSDIEVRHNHMFKPLIWMKGQPGFVGGPTGDPFIVKNLFELKNAQRVLFEGNIMENSWGGFSQHGYGLVLTPKNQADWNSTGNLCPMCLVTDVTIRYSTISHVAAGLAIANILSSNGGAPRDGQRYSIHDITVDDIDGAKYNGPGIFAMLAMTADVPVLQNVLIDHVTAFPPHTFLGVGNYTSGLQMVNISLNNSISAAGVYPVWSTGGATNCAYYDKPLITFNACFNPYSFAHNAIVGSSSNYPPSLWPPSTFFPPNASAAQFVDYKNGNGGDYHLLPSSPYKNAGTDGKDLGADVDAILVKIADAY